jgi:hypothetical protein
MLIDDGCLASQEQRMSDVSTLIDRYLAAYGDPDKTRRAQAVGSLWAEHGQLIDPPLSATGHAQIVAQADALLSQFPGHRFRRSSGVDSHHGFARYAWQLLDPAGAVALEGCDVAQIDAQGRLVQVVGFFGPLPALEPAG